MTPSEIAELLRDARRMHRQLDDQHRRQREPIYAHLAPSLQLRLVLEDLRLALRTEDWFAVGLAVALLEDIRARVLAEEDQIRARLKGR